MSRYLQYLQYLQYLEYLDGQATLLLAASSHPLTRAEKVRVSRGTCYSFTERGECLRWPHAAPPPVLGRRESAPPISAPILRGRRVHQNIFNPLILVTIDFVSVEWS